MTTLRSRRLESLFGKALDNLTSDDIQSLVTNNVAESFDLDFKQSLYERSEKGKITLAGDIAALANTAGGILILGVKEDRKSSIAIDAPGVMVSDGETRRMRQISANLLAPFPTFDIIPINIPGANGVGFYVIAVPRSVGAPHAVLIDYGLRYPQRNGSTTRYLSEAEVAAAYLDRTRRHSQQGVRLGEVQAESIPRLDGTQSWLTVALVPDIAGTMEITLRSVRNFTNEVANRPATEILAQGGVSLREVIAGRQKINSYSHLSRGGEHSSASFQAYTDGSGLYGIAIENLARREDSPQSSGGILLSEEGIADAAISGILRLAQHARNRAAAGGNAAIQLRLIPDFTASGNLSVGNTRGGFPQQAGVAIKRETTKPVEIVASLDDIAAAGPELVASAARAVNQLAHTFGVPEFAQLTVDGQLRQRYWGRGWQSPVAAWALPAKVELIDDLLD